MEEEEGKCPNETQKEEKRISLSLSLSLSLSALLNKPAVDRRGVVLACWNIICSSGVCQLSPYSIRRRNCLLQCDTSVHSHTSYTALHYQQTIGIHPTVCIVRHITEKDVANSFRKSRRGLRTLTGACEREENTGSEDNIMISNV